MAEDIETADRLARIETKLDTVLTIIPNHDCRIRDLEMKKEECQQDSRLDKIEVRLDDGEKRFDALEIKVTSHITAQKTAGEGDHKANSQKREWLILFVGIIGGSIITAIVTKAFEVIFS
jgi:hypothetical protein